MAGVAVEVWLIDTSSDSLPVKEALRVAVEVDVGGGVTVCETVIVVVGGGVMVWVTDCVSVSESEKEPAVAV